jgi:ABC-type uncharacterized transport system auxiliary subunit
MKVRAFLRVLFLVSVLAMMAGCVSSEQKVTSFAPEDPQPTQLDMSYAGPEPILQWVILS